MTNVNQAPLPRLSKAPLVRASLVKRRYIKYLALPLPFTNDGQDHAVLPLSVIESKCVLGIKTSVVVLEESSSSDLKSLFLSTARAGPWTTKAVLEKCHRLHILQTVSYV